MLRIALISEHASPLITVGGVDGGGQNIYVAQLSRRLGALGHRVDVFTRRDSKLQPPMLQWQRNVRVIHVPAGPATSIAKEQLLPMMGEFGEYFYRFVQKQRRRYDIIHGNFFMSGLAARSTALAFDIPLVMTFHALGHVRRHHQAMADRFPAIRTHIETELVRCASRVIAECPQDRDDLLSLYQADPEKLDLVPCGFDLLELPTLDRAHARRVLGWHPQRYTLLQLGRMVPRKGVDNVIRALASLRQRQGIDAVLYVVGGNHERPDPALTPEIGRLLSLAAELGVADDVHFLGQRGRESLAYLYQAADVFVTTPWYEPFGITPVEAMACALPVIGSAVGGIRSTVLDGRTGLLVPPQDPLALSHAMAQLARDRALRQRLGAAGRARAYRHFTWERVVQGVMASYERAREPALSGIAQPALRAAV